MRLSAWLLAFHLCSVAQELPDAAAAGRPIFESQCSVCHGLTGTGGRGPALNRPKLSKAPDDEALRKLIGQGSGNEMPGAWQLSPREVAHVAAFVRSLAAIPPEPVPGDPKRGAAVYEAKQCSTCHIINGSGSGYGPELTSIGARRNSAHLREALLKPAAFVAAKYLFVEAVAGSGTVRGIRANEDSFTIQIKAPNGRFHSFGKSDLQELRKLSGQSAMPDYGHSLSAHELADLTAYLMSLRGSECSVLSFAWPQEPSCKLRSLMPVSQILHSTAVTGSRIPAITRDIVSRLSAK